jgi:hypothetical protein
VDPIQVGIFLRDLPEIHAGREKFTGGTGVPQKDARQGHEI